MAAITNDWLGPLSSEFKKPYYKELYKTVKHEYETKGCFLNRMISLTHLHLHRWQT